MTGTEIKKAAQASISAGKSKQETFDTLRETSGVPEKTLANIIKIQVTPAAKEKYNSLNMVLVLVLCVLALLRVGDIFLLLKTSEFSVLYVVPLIINILFIVGVMKYWTGFHMLVYFLTLLGLLRSFVSLAQLATAGQGLSIPMIFLAEIVLMIIVIILAFNLSKKLTPKFKTITSPAQNANGQIQNVTTIKFVD